MTYLFDVSVLLALLWENHVHHTRVRLWEKSLEIAICPITELGFLRISTQAFNATMDDARQSLSRWLEKRSPKFVPCDSRVLHGEKAPTGARTTDFYLAHLAHTHGMKLATLDQDIKQPAAFLIPTQ